MSRVDGLDTKTSSDLLKYLSPLSILELFKTYIEQMQRRKGKKGAIEKEIEETKRKGYNKKKGQVLN